MAVGSKTYRGIIKVLRERYSYMNICIDMARNGISFTKGEEIDSMLLEVRRMNFISSAFSNEERLIIERDVFNKYSDSTFWTLMSKSLYYRDRDRAYKHFVDLLNS